jgi:hypothetical protein
MVDLLKKAYSEKQDDLLENKRPSEPIPAELKALADVMKTG